MDTIRNRGLHNAATPCPVVYQVAGVQVVVDQMARVQVVVNQVAGVQVVRIKWRPGVQAVLDQATEAEVLDQVTGAQMLDQVTRVQVVAGESSGGNSSGGSSDGVSVFCSLLLRFAS